jgi:hypothetical protein
MTSRQLMVCLDLFQDLGVMMGLILIILIWFDMLYDKKWTFSLWNSLNAMVSYMRPLECMKDNDWTHGVSRQYQAIHVLTLLLCN